VTDGGERGDDFGSGTNIQKIMTSMNRTISPRIPPPVAPCQALFWMVTALLLAARTRGVRQAWMSRAVKVDVLDAMMGRGVGCAGSGFGSVAIGASIFTRRCLDFAGEGDGDGDGEHYDETR